MREWRFCGGKSTLAINILNVTRRPSYETLDERAVVLETRFTFRSIDPSNVDDNRQIRRGVPKSRSYVFHLRDKSMTILPSSPFPVTEG